ncbi:MAG: O-antigen ligase family protein [Vicinamibacteraceae bacterium]
MTTTTTALQAPPLFRVGKLEALTIGALVGFLAAAQLSVAPAYIMLAVTFAGWAAVVYVQNERVEVPMMFWWLVAYGVATVFSALNSVDPTVSLIDCKQLVLFLIVPVVYRFARGPRALTFATLIISVGALSALIGIAQFGLLHYDNLSQRPHGSLTHYMTYSGVLMLVACAAAARLVFRRDGTTFLGGSRTWTVLVMPALIVALALTFTRSAWVGLVAGVGVLIVLKDRRLLAGIPLVVALTILVAPTSVTARMYSMFDVNDPSNKDRVAMLESGLEIVRDHPFTGVGPDMVKSVYKEYRQPWAVNDLNVHLHNVPVHIAAERGLPALLIWIGFIVFLSRDLIRRVMTSRQPSLAAGGLAAVAAMVAAGLFEYNFGDSEFLMLFLVLITLPYASDRPAADADAR